MEITVRCTGAHRLTIAGVACNDDTHQAASALPVPAAIESQQAVEGR
jgi:hypothetical protein